MAAAALTGWLFARRHRRLYSDSEFWRLTIYCATWAILFESIVLLGVIVVPELHAGHVDVSTLLVAGAITVAVDSLVVWMAHRFTGRRVIAWYLREHSVDRS